MLRCSDASGFGDESPVFNKKTKELAYVQISKKENICLEKLYKQLLEFLQDRPTKNYIPEKQIKTYLALVEKPNPVSPKSRWILMKIRGLVSYMLKKRQEFNCSLASGKITIYEKPLQIMNTDNSDVISVPSDFPTNNNFVTVSNEMGCKSNNNSEDIVGETVESLHNFSEENKLGKKIFDDLISNEELKALFVEELELVENCVTDIVDDLLHLEIGDSPNTSPEIPLLDDSTASTESTAIKPCYDVENDDLLHLEIGDSPNTSPEIPLLDDSTASTESTAIKPCYDVENDDLLHLEIGDSPNTSPEIPLLDDSTASTESTAIKPCYDVENCITIREISTQTKENLKKIEKNEQVEKMVKLINML